MRGRHKLLDRPVPWTVNIPASVDEKVRRTLADPLTKQPPQGALSDLVTSLLRGFLDGRFDVPVKKNLNICPECLGDLTGGPHECPKSSSTAK